MAVVKYEEGDEERLDMTDESRRAFMSAKREILADLKNGEAFTIKFAGSVKAVCAIVKQPGGVMDCWCLFDKKAGAGALRSVKRLLDFYALKTDVILTLSEGTRRNKKLHRVLGFNKHYDFEEGKELWVKS